LKRVRAPRHSMGGDLRYAGKGRVGASPLRDCSNQTPKNGRIKKKKNSLV